MASRDNALTRRRFILGTVGATVALAGCSESDTPTEGDGTDLDDSESTPTTEDSTPSSNTTQTDGEETTPEESDSVCAPLAGSPTAYDVSGTPYVFGFDYPETWTIGDPIPGQNGRFQQITSPAVSVNGDPKTATVRVGQALPALSASEAEAEKTDLLTRDVDPFAVVDEQTFDGETVDVLGFPDVPQSSYPPAYTLYLPYGSGDSRAYYRTSIVTYSDVYGLEEEDSDACNELIRSATETVRGSLRPNPETTVDSA